LPNNPENGNGRPWGGLFFGSALRIAPPNFVVLVFVFLFIADKLAHDLIYQLICGRKLVDESLSAAACPASASESSRMSHYCSSVPSPNPLAMVFNCSDFRVYHSS
jgi:hypothetical protein